MGSISCHIMLLVINSLAADTHANTHTDVRSETILRNQVSASHRPAHTWFKNTPLLNPVLKKTYMPTNLMYVAKAFEKGEVNRHYMAAIVMLLEGVAIEMKSVIESNLLRKIS